MKKYIYLAVAALGLTSCSDFLEREPLDFGDENSYFQSSQDLEYSVNAFYEYLPKSSDFWGGLYTEDTNSDNQQASGFNNLFYKNEKRTVKIANSEWNFQNLRAINFFINKVEGKIDDIKGDTTLVQHYLGEAYFFRAYDYFRLLRNFGDVPILTQMQTDDREQLAANSKRAPRNEVARFIIADLEKALTLLEDNPPAAGRVAKDAAYALMSRVALFEGTWEKYHANTCFVPGNSKWVGAASNPDFAFKAGSAKAESDYFLKVAYEAAEKAIDNHPLAPDSLAYLEMFRSITTNFGNNHEVILARYYQTGVMSHSCSALLRNGGGCGVTRSAVNTFVMKESGLPIYADSKYEGDKTSWNEFHGRDPRLTGSVRDAGFIIGATPKDTVFYYQPHIYNSGREKATTGYEMRKWCSNDYVQQQQYQCTTAVPLFRSAELMLNYIEAYYELNGNLGGKCDEYWKALRDRVGVNTDYNATIAATDLDKENDLAVYSKGQKVDATLYNIRRERRCELLAEGLRLDDLKRWRALDTMVNYQVEGFNLWEQMYKMYSTSQVSADVVSQKGVSTYMRPLQVSNTSVVYDGYTFPKQHYLEPIPISEFLLVGSVLYQNPGWPDRTDGVADYNYDCD